MGKYESAILPKGDTAKLFLLRIFCLWCDHRRAFWVSFEQLPSMRGECARRLPFRRALRRDDLLAVFLFGVETC